MTRTIKRLSVFISLVVAFTLVSPNILWAVEESGTQHEEEFNAGKMIIDHIVDAYEWHLLTIGETHVSVYLPVILFDEGQFHVFSSSKFHHGHSSYDGYKIETEGFFKGSIVKTKGDSMETDTEASLPFDISITKHVLALFFSLTLLLVVFISVARKYKRNPNKAPNGFQGLIEPLIIFIRDDVAKTSIGEKKYEKYTPYLLTLFFFIFLNNLLGLIPIFPGGANLTGDISVTMTLALFTFFITQFIGTKNYWAHIFNTPDVPWYLKVPIPIMPIIEIVGAVIKPFVLMIRLFANISAGHIIVLGFVSLIFILGNVTAPLGFGISVISVPLSIFMSFIELLVAFIQAYVFTLLTALYFGSATQEGHH
ncbi:MAG: F0F1 ATP synthase subunit A [Bacteroidales bacterium]|nr:F0F1 ATP synthase subunit A [Bacteroidales bacterium]